MSPAEHYRKAESLLDDAQAYAGTQRFEIAELTLREAQVHATLAAIREDPYE